jgi:hypothetical protein
MTNLADFVPENKQMLCFVGKGGHGKSIGASYWPKPMYMASCDGRISAVYNWWNNRDPFKLKDIEFDTYTAGDYDKLAIKMEGFQTKNPFKKGTIVLDPLTMIGDMLIQYSFAQGTTGGGAPRGRIKIAGPDEYRTENAGLKKLIDGGRVLNSHFILCAHILEDTYYALGEEKPRVTRKLLTAGKAPAAALPGMFDELWLFTIKSDGVVGKPPKHFIVTRPSEEFDTLRTSCGMPVEKEWTDKDLYAIASPYLNAPRKGVPVIQKDGDVIPGVEAQILAENKTSNPLNNKPL